MKAFSRLERALVAVFAFFIMASATAQVKTPDGIKHLATVEGISEYLIESNGLHILLFPDASKPSMTVNITYMVGSRHEAYGETGMAHLLEHLVFKGTPNHPDIPQELTEHGARPNGTTWYDRTNYFETFSASEENLRWALDMEADRMINSYIAKEDLDSEMTVVRNEFEMGENNPSSILMERVLSTAYLWHNYGKSTIGARADIENVPIERLQAFYRKYYQPDNAHLVVAGKIDEEQTLEMIKEYFGPIPAPERKLFETYTREPIQDGERFAELERTGDLQVVSAAYHICPGSHHDYAAVDVLVELLTNEPSGRLYKELIESDKASSQWGWAASLAEPGFAYFSVDVLKEKDAKAAEQTLLSVLDGLKENPPTAEEVERAKTGLLKDYNLFMRESDRVGRYISEFIAQGDWRLAFIYRDRLEQVTPEQVVEVANRYFKSSNRTVGRFMPTAKPDRADVPDVPNIAAMVDGYEGREAVAEGEAFDPSYDNIDKRTNTGEMKKTMEYALLSKETRADAVVAQLRLRMGTEQSLKGKQVAADFAAMMLEKGTANMSRQAIEDKMDELKANISIYGGATGVNVRIETDHENLAASIDLVGEILKEASFPEDEFNTLKSEEIAGLEEYRSDPQSVAFTALQRKLRRYAEDDPRYVMNFEEEIAAVKALKLEEVKAFYDEFYGASDATVAIVGDFDEAAITAVLEKNFKTWTSDAKYSRLESKFFDTKGEHLEFETPDKANAWFLVGQNMEISSSHPDYPAMMLGNFILGGGFLNSRLATRIRQEEGLSYGVGSFFNANDVDDAAMLGGYAFFAPENLEAVEKAFFEELERAKKDGFTSEEIEAAKSGWQQGQQLNRSQDRSLASTLNNNLQLDRSMEWSADLEAKVMALTPEQINAVIAKYLDPSKMIVVKAGDFAKTKVTKP